MGQPVEPDVLVVKLQIAIEYQRPEIHVVVDGIANDDPAVRFGQEDKGGSVREGERDANQRDRCARRPCDAIRQPPHHRAAVLRASTSGASSTSSASSVVGAVTTSPASSADSTGCSSTFRRRTRENTAARRATSWGTKNRDQASTPKNTTTTVVPCSKRPAIGVIAGTRTCASAPPLIAAITIFASRPDSYFTGKNRCEKRHATNARTPYASMLAQAAPAMQKDGTSSKFVTTLVAAAMPVAIG